METVANTLHTQGTHVGEHNTHYIHTQKHRCLPKKNVKYNKYCHRLIMQK